MFFVFKGFLRVCFFVFKEFWGMFFVFKRFLDDVFLFLRGFWWGGTVKFLTPVLSSWQVNVK